MVKYIFKALTILFAALLLTSCGFFQPAVPKTESPFLPVDLNAGLNSGRYLQKADSFLVLLDSSGTMQEAVGERSKFDLARETVSRMNATIPDLKLTAGLRTFGEAFSNETTLTYGLAPYSKEGLENSLQNIRRGGFTPLGRALQAALGDLEPASGNLALIVVSDGVETDNTALEAAQNLKSRYGDRICIYTVLAGDHPWGKHLMEKVAAAGGCGFATSAAGLSSADSMAGFVRSVFLAEKADSDGDGVADAADRCPDTPPNVKVDARGCPLDSDGDGVYDYLDQCPNTPKGTPVDDRGCSRKAAPVDSDGDGVYDELDRCPGTPRGARVDERGCWIIEGAFFDFDRYEVKPDYFPALNNVVSVMKQNPRLKVLLHGHTDNLGSEAYNKRLSVKRARAVMDYLLNRGIAPERIRYLGYGFSKPIAPNDTEKGREKNRRVEIEPL